MEEVDHQLYLYRPSGLFGPYGKMNDIVGAGSRPGDETGNGPGHDNEQESGGDVGIAVEEGRPELKEPRKFKVLLHNDDYTTMEFVIEVLTSFFHKTAAQAQQVMLKVHQEGVGVAGIFSFEIAETKAAQVEEAARSRGFPLKCTIEPE